ncbi:class I SAM-dependent methyltransferase [Candidatus Peregrinibacteria bacterium]|nr:class I SAM-dependent methyltransferase [Candidatus Peregrinibacteria bacterium]
MIYREIEKIHGWLTKNEALFLYNSAKQIKKENAIVEIGSWKGRSTICLGKGSSDGNGVKIYAIDPHTGCPELWKKYGRVNTFREFQQNISKACIADYIEIIKDTSQNAAKKITKPVEFIFIDGDHSYHSTNLDFKLWFPKVKNGGILAFHDSWHFIGPKLVTAINLLFSSKIRNPKMVDSITYFQKVQKNSFFERIKNILFLLFRTFIGIKGWLRVRRSESLHQQK